MREVMVICYFDGDGGARVGSVRRLGAFLSVFLRELHARLGETPVEMSVVTSGDEDRRPWLAVAVRAGGGA